MSGLSPSTITLGEAVLLRWISPAAGIGLACWMVLSRWVTVEAGGLVLGLIGARFTVPRGMSSTGGLPPSGDSSPL